MQNIHSELLRYMCVFLQKIRFEVANRADVRTELRLIFMIQFFDSTGHKETKSLIRR